MNNRIVNNKFLFYGLIFTFILLYIAIGFVSTLHAISFFQLANPLFLAILLGSSFELGQSSVLFYILMSKEKKMLPWLIMLLLVFLQICGNVYSSFKFIDLSGSNNWSYFQRSLLFSIQADTPEMYKVIISWIQGALLPIVTLSMTSLIAHIIQARDEIKNKEPIEEELKTFEEKEEKKEEEKEEEKEEDIRITNDEEKDFSMIDDINKTPIIDNNTSLEKEKPKKEKKLKVPKVLKKVLGRLKTGKLVVL